MGKDCFEIFKKKINLFPSKALFKVIKFIGITTTDINYQLFHLTNSNNHKFIKQQAATNLMFIFKEGQIELILFEIGYSLGHINFILKDLEFHYSQLFKEK
jgi:hypothetical protein